MFVFRVFWGTLFVFPVSCRTTRTFGFYPNEVVQTWNDEEFDIDGKLCSPNFWKQETLECQRRFQSFFNQQLDFLNFSVNHHVQKNTTIFPKSSSFSSATKYSTPAPQKWSQCMCCSMIHGKVLLHDPSTSLRELYGEHASGTVEVVLAQSQYHLIHQHAFAQILGKFTDEPFELHNCVRTVDRPAFVFYIYDMQIGHLIVDILESLHHTMIAVFSEINTDVYIFISPVISRGNPELNFKYLLAALAKTSAFSLLRMYTQHPIYTIDALSLLDGQICFSHGLYLELDVTHHFYSHGYNFEPDAFNTNRTIDRNIRERYKSFRRYVHSFYNISGTRMTFKFDDTQNRERGNSTLLDWSVLIIQRSRKGRHIENEDAMSSLSYSIMQGYITGGKLSSGSISRLDLDKLTFGEQLVFFSQASIMIGMFGSGLHNMLFLPDGATIIVFMQAGFCDRAWIYSTQAILCGLHVFVQCEHSALHQYSRIKWWSSPYHRVSPDYHYDGPHSVDLRIFERFFREAVEMSILKTRPTKSYEAPVIVYKQRTEPYNISFVGISSSENNFHAWGSFFPYSIQNDFGRLTFAGKLVVYSRLPGLELLKRYPGLQVCVGDGIGTMNFTSACFNWFDFYERDMMFFNEAYGSPRSLAIWLVDSLTGAILPNSMAIFPLGSTYSWLAQDRSYKYPQHMRRSVGVHLFKDAKTLRFDARLEEEGILQFNISCFCQVYALTMVQCSSLALQVHLLLEKEIEDFHKQSVLIDWKEELYWSP